MLEKVQASWKESFYALYPQHLIRHLGLSCLSLIDLYRALFRAWFLPLSLILGFLLQIPSLMYAFYVTLLIRATRPSIDKKAMSYWQQMVLADWVLFLGLVVLLQAYQQLPQAWWYSFVVVSRILLVHLLSWLPGTDMLFIIFLSPFVIIWVLFMLDARMTLWQYTAALGRALTMLFFNYPFFFVLYGSFRVLLSGAYLLSWPFLSSYPQLSTLGWLLLYLVVFPYYVCLLTNYYIKKIHEQFSLYWG